MQLVDSETSHELQTQILPCGETYFLITEAVLEMLGRFNEDLSSLQRAIRWEDADALEKLFQRTRKIRKGILDAGQA